MRLSICLLWLGLALLACGGRSSEPSPAPPPPAGHAARWEGSCGVRIFDTPACQSALDSVCCPLEMECARDPDCSQLQHCLNGCKANAGPSLTNCMNGCGLRARVAYCHRACRGGGAGCFEACSRHGGPGEPQHKWELISSCGKSVRYPDGVDCDEY